MAARAEVLRARACALRLEADGLRQTAFRVRMVGATVRWRSPAADAFRARVEGRAASLQRSAEWLHEAAGALEAHAAAVEQAERLAAAVVERMGRVLQ